jgi:ATP-binding cassette subfamily B protein
MINSLTQGGDLTVFGIGLAKMAIIYGVGALSTYASSRLMVGIAQKTTNSIRAKLFNHMQDLPLRYFTVVPTGN